MSKRDALPISDVGEHRCNRRTFLRGAGTLVAVSLAPMPWANKAVAAEAKVVTYEAKKLGSLSALEVGKPVPAFYPGADGDALSSIFVVKLGEPAGGGIGPDGDVVAFSAYCTHMGMPLHGNYKAEHKVMGPCPLHLTTFDLTRHGMVVAGHATESLPQVVLEAKGDDIMGTGMLGLQFGRATNQV